MKATDKHKLIDRIKTLEGLTDDERSALLDLIRESKTYGLVWEDKPEDVEDRLRDYPLIMKQQTIDDKVIKDLFGVSGQELHDIRTAIAGLQKGELIIKDQMAFALGMGSKYKKINVTHLI